MFLMMYVYRKTMFKSLMSTSPPPSPTDTQPVLTPLTSTRAWEMAETIRTPLCSCGLYVIKCNIKCKTNNSNTGYVCQL